MQKLITLKSERSFDRFLSNKSCVVIVHHFLCHGCQVYLEDLKKNLQLFVDVPLAKMHMTLKWVINEAGLYGDVEEENMFLKERYGVGNLFPTTLFFRNKELVKRVDGVMPAQELKQVMDEIL